MFARTELAVEARLTSPVTLSLGVVTRTGRQHPRYLIPVSSRLWVRVFVHFSVCDRLGSMEFTGSA